MVYILNIFLLLLWIQKFCFYAQWFCDITFYFIMVIFRQLIHIISRLTNIFAQLWVCNLFEGYLLFFVGVSSGKIQSTILFVNSKGLESKQFNYFRILVHRNRSTLLKFKSRTTILFYTSHICFKKLHIGKFAMYHALSL